MSRRIIATTALVVAFIGFGTAAQAASRAGLVIVHGDGRRVERIVTFDQAKLTGTGLLRLSGLSNSIVNAAAGQAVYMIDGEGDPNGWVTKDGRNYYWSYFRLVKGKWVYSPVGAGLTTVKNGDVDAWVWQYYGQNATPPVLTFGELAGQATAAAKKARTRESSWVSDYVVWIAIAGILAGLTLYFLGRRPGDEQ